MIRVCLWLCLIVCSGPLEAEDYRNATVDELLASGQRPEGVVFDLISWDDHSWDWASPMLHSLIDQLHGRYPGLETALVSHGFELFALSERSGGAARESITLLRSLANAGLDVYVSGRYASTRFYQAEDFLPFVKVAASGEAQIEDYMRLGFVRVELEVPDGLD